MKRLSLNVNGVDRWIVADPARPLADVLREQMMLTGCKVCCADGQCGSCTVLIDGKPIRACMTALDKVAPGAKIVTIEGIGTPENLHPLQIAWMAHGSAQCGICSPGFIMSAKALLDRTLTPTREEVRAWFHRNRNLCRCTGYKPLIDSVMDAAAIMRGDKTIYDVMPKAKEDGSILGTKYIRPSAVAKVTGTWDFGADVALKMPAGTLRLALVQAEVSHALVKGIDTSEAEKMPGVEKVITWKDVGGKNAITGLITFPTNKGDGWDRPILCKEPPTPRRMPAPPRNWSRSMSRCCRPICPVSPRWRRTPWRSTPACPTPITSRASSRAPTRSRCWRAPPPSSTSPPIARASRICIWSRIAAKRLSMTTAC
jgi:aldehyde oxidoreductase